MASDASQAGGLAGRSCKACAGDVRALDDAETEAFLAELPGWELSNRMIARTFCFKNYYETMAFVNASAWIGLAPVKTTASGMST